MNNLANERRDRTRIELTNLVNDRTEMLSQYCLLAGTGEKTNSTDNQELESDNILLQEFCENLIDYLAKGHFELYQRIHLLLFYPMFWGKICVLLDLKAICKVHFDVDHLLFLNEVF